MLAELARMKYGILRCRRARKDNNDFVNRNSDCKQRPDPTAAIGGKLRGLQEAMQDWGQGDFLVAEADESDGSFPQALLRPSQL